MNVSEPNRLRDSLHALNSFKSSIRDLIRDLHACMHAYVGRYVSDNLCGKIWRSRSRSRSMEMELFFSIPSNAVFFPLLSFLISLSLALPHLLLFSSLLFSSLPSRLFPTPRKEQKKGRRRKKLIFFNHQLNFLNSLNYQRWLRSRRELAGRVCKCRRRSERGLGRGWWWLWRWRCFLAFWRWWWW